VLVADHAGNIMPRALGHFGYCRGGMRTAHRPGHRHCRSRPAFG
jgi:predicted N-formylglutamate amidohydrolase